MLIDKALMLTNKEDARYLALRSITGQLSFTLNTVGVVQPGFASNEFISEKRKRAARREYENILRQLERRLDKLDQKKGE